VNVHTAVWGNVPGAYPAIAVAVGVVAHMLVIAAIVVVVMGHVQVEFILTPGHRLPRVTAAMFSQGGY
jgi:hypothetical protein